MRSQPPSDRSRQGSSVRIAIAENPLHRHRRQTRHHVDAVVADPIVPDGQQAIEPASLVKDGTGKIERMTFRRVERQLIDFEPDRGHLDPPHGKPPAALRKIAICPAATASSGRARNTFSNRW